MSVTKARKLDWDEWVAGFNSPAFIAQDPISIAHRYKDHPDWRNCECAAFLAALFSYGRRDKILGTLSQIVDQFGAEPVTYLTESTAKQRKKAFKSFYYRFNRADDLIFLLDRLAEIYREGPGTGHLKSLWQASGQESADLKEQIHRFRHRFLWEGRTFAPDTYGIKFLFADPAQNSAAKRFNMFLRWMVRHDEVDLGLWADVTSPRQLMIPLDTHVAKTARKFRITERQSNDWKTVEEITAYFRKLCPEDPVRYDFALFGLGLNHRP